MRLLLEVTITCPRCATRVPVHLDAPGGGRLVGRCGRCGEVAACELQPDPHPLEPPVAAGEAHR
jgi:predicted Zn finger-like uncharacterized protein